MHRPVMVEETMKYLAPEKNGTYIDATLGAGGHALEILKRARGAVVLGIERDNDLAAYIRDEKIDGLIVEEGNYTDMKKIARKQHQKNIRGVLFDFGLSSWHLEKSGRGFSFQQNEPLDMRYSIRDNTRAAELLNTLSQDDLADIFYKYGEESNSRAIARAIVRARKEKRITTTRDLVDIISAVIKRRGKIHPATRVFQALRIAVNRELDAVREGIQEAMDLVATRGRVVAISYHSLEDRIVKHAFNSRGLAVTKKPLVPSRAEVESNPRARSARLRAWENV